MIWLILLGSTIDNIWHLPMLLLIMIPFIFHHLEECRIADRLIAYLDDSEEVNYNSEDDELDVLYEDEDSVEWYDEDDGYDD